MADLEELRPDLDIVELKPGQVLVINKPDNPKEFWLACTFDGVCEALTNYKPDDEDVRFNYDHPEHNDPAPREDLVSGQVTYKLPEWLAREKGLVGEKVSGVVEQETDKAILLKIGKPPRTDEIWLPKSQIEEVIVPEDQVRF